jgi:hypothetical protein
MWAYQFQARGTKKCQVPKPIDAALPIATSALIAVLVMITL